MERPNHNPTEGRSLHAASVFYYGMLLVAFVIGLYGLFSLFWLAAGAFERSSYNPVSPF